MLTYRLPIVLGIRLDGGSVTTVPVLAWLIAPIQAFIFSYLTIPYFGFATNEEH